MKKIIFSIVLELIMISAYAQRQTHKALLDSISEYIIEMKISHPDIVLRQAILETGWFKPCALMKKNNLFGFRTRAGYLTFPDWKSAVQYYKTWQTTYYTNPEEDYFHFLKRIKYANGDRYTLCLKKIILDGKTFITSTDSLYKEPIMKNQ